MNMQAKVKKLIREGKSVKQAVAIAYDMEREKRKGPKKKKKDKK